MIDGIIVFGMIAGMFLAAFTAGCLLLKACFKIANVIFK